MGIKIVMLVMLIAFYVSAEIEEHEPTCPNIPINCQCKDYTKKFVQLPTVPTGDDAIGDKVCETLISPFHVCKIVGCLYNPDLEPLRLGTKLKRTDPFGIAIPYLLPAANYSHRSPRSLSLWKMKENLVGPRHTKPCYMKPLYTAFVACWDWTYFYDCNVTCLPGFGHKTENGSARSYNTKCHLGSNFWYPLDYDDCEPVGFNCDARLIAPGSIACGKTAAGRYCDIECFKQDKYSYISGEDVSLKRYECVDDTFGSTLPWCAILRNVSVIEEPDEPYN